MRERRRDHSCGEQEDLANSSGDTKPTLWKITCTCTLFFLMGCVLLRMAYDLLDSRALFQGRCSLQVGKLLGFACAASALRVLDRVGAWRFQVMSPLLYEYSTYRFSFHAPSRTHQYSSPLRQTYELQLGPLCVRTLHS